MARLIEPSGHVAARERLREGIPPALLISGPAGVGKRTLALWAASQHGAAGPDLAFYPKLLRDVATELTRRCMTRPTGKLRAFIVRTDGASPEAANAILKLVEEGPPRTSFIFLAASAPLLTIASRCELVRLAYLRPEEVEAALVARGMSPEAALEAVESTGARTVAEATPAEDAGAGRGKALAAAKAMASGDLDLARNALEGWTDEESRSLEAWATEATTGRHRTFSPEEFFGLEGGPVPRRVRAGLRSGARARIAARATVLPIVLERRG